MMEHLVAGARALGLTISDKQLSMFQKFYEALVEWNERFNLTAITEYEQVQIRHFLDSLSCIMAFKHWPDQGAAPVSCIDVGSGAGFPGVPLKIYCPHMHMVLLEATGKKVDFVQYIAAHLELKNVTPLWGRAEEVAQDPAHRERYDLVVARAVAELPILAEYTLPFCRLGGLVIAQKGDAAREETQAAGHAIAILGGRLKKVIPVELVGLAETRNLVVIEKAVRTPPQYPRHPGIPSKRPLTDR